MKTKLLRRVRKHFELKLSKEDNIVSPFMKDVLIARNKKTNDIMVYNTHRNYDYVGQCNQFACFILDNRSLLGVSRDEITIHNLNIVKRIERTLLNKKYKHLFDQ